MKKFLILVVAIIFLLVGGSAQAWEGDMTVGATLQSGNTDSSSMSVSAKASKRVDRERYTGKINFNYAEEGDELIDRNISGSVQYDTFLTDKVYALLNIGLQKDKQRNLNFETIVGPGVGYQVTDSFNVEAGIAYYNRDVIVGEDSQWMTARLGLNYNWDITDTFRFNDSLNVNPSLEDFGLYTLRNEADFIYMFSDKWSGKITHVLQYDKGRSTGVKKLDKTLLAGLQYNF